MTRVVNELNLAKTHAADGEGIIGELRRMLTHVQVNLDLSRAGVGQREAELNSSRAELFQTRVEAQRDHAELYQEAERAHRSNGSLNESMGELVMLELQIQAHKFALDPTIANAQQRYDAYERETACTMK